MGIANDLKVNAGNLEGDLRASVGDLKERVNGLAWSAREGMEHAEGDLRDGAHTLKERAMGGLDAAQAEIREVASKIGWKTVAGIAGFVVVAGMLLLARRRANRGNLLQRGLREGSRYAMLVPAGWHKAQRSAVQYGHEAARESERLWNKIPRIHVELK
jgi:hypothetical protein